MLDKQETGFEVDNMIEKTGTCNGCGYEKRHCMCGRKRNTSGDYAAYQNYRDYRNINDYAMTARINRTSVEERKIMEELLPVDGELLTTYIKRSSVAEQKLTEHSIQHHLYGTKKVWACHTSSRYCFICTMAQYVNVHRALWNSLADVIDISKITISVNVVEGEPPHLGLNL